MQEDAEPARLGCPPLSAFRAGPAVSEADALRFACNAINIGRTILLNRISLELSARLTALGYQVLQVELTEILKAGGAAKCLALRTSERDVTHRV